MGADGLSKPEALGQSETDQGKQQGCMASGWVRFVCWLGSWITGVSIVANDIAQATASQQQKGTQQ
jgi:hypothetical protein